MDTTHNPMPELEELVHYQNVTSTFFRSSVAWSERGQHFTVSIVFRNLDSDMYPHDVMHMLLRLHDFAENYGYRSVGRTHIQLHPENEVRYMQYISLSYYRDRYWDSCNSSSASVLPD